MKKKGEGRLIFDVSWLSSSEARPGPNSLSLFLLSASARQGQTVGHLVEFSGATDQRRQWCGHARAWVLHDEI